LSDTHTEANTPSPAKGKSPPAQPARLTITQAAPLVRLKTYELVAQRLLDDIAASALPAGSLVPGEVELADTLGVGRSSVREALRVLESRGLIGRTDNGRFVVAEQANPLASGLSVLYDLHRVQMSELFELRNMIEIEAAGLAAERRTGTDLQLLGATLGEMRWGSSTPDELLKTDVRFHVQIAEAGGNRAFARLIEALRDVVYSALHGPLFTRTDRDDWSSETVVEHTRILDAIAAQDVEGAREAMGAHLKRVSDQALALLVREARTSPSDPE
jgi:GntR family transcriptional repressor for pyruvate dehydrogenase complex